MTERTQEYVALAARTYQDLLIGDRIHAGNDEPDGHYAGDCATGWVDGKDIEEYSMGLNPEDTGA